MKIKKLVAMLLSAAMVFSFAATGALAAGREEITVDRLVTSTADNLSSFAGGGWTEADDDYAFVSALFVNGGKIDERSVLEAITAGTYDEKGADGLVIKSKYEGFNPIIIHDSVYTLKNVDITIDAPQSNGLVTNDFSGFGAAIATYGDSTVLTLEDSKVNVSGVANLTIFTDDGSDIIIKNSQLHSDGGTLHADYRNSPDQSTMVAPPWILGIMGSSRCTNLMGNNSSMTVIESKTTAGQWAVLSTDSGQNMTLTVIDSYMGLTGADYDLQADGRFQTEWGKTGATANPYTSKSGYGTYTIGNSNQKFYGTDMEVGTYANIYTGGIGLYTAMKAGEAIDYLNANGEVVGTYVPAKDKVTTINSDTFGFMAHQGTNAVTVEQGTVVNSGYTTFLYKSGCSIDAAFTSGTVLNPGNGILVQALDNDDSTTGMDVSTFSFFTDHVENPGWPTENMQLGNNAGNFTFTDVELVGDIFNGSGWKLNGNNSGMGGDLTAVALNVVLDGTTTLEGQISSTATIHVTKEGSDAIKAAPAGQKASEEWVKYQNTSFPIGHYFDIGQVANMVKSSGANVVNVTVADEAVWTVTADGIVNNVTAASSAIVAEKPVTLTVEGTLTLDGKVVTEDTTVGNVTYHLVVAEPETPAPEGGEGGMGDMGGGMGGPGGPGGGPGGPGGGPGGPGGGGGDPVVLSGNLTVVLEDGVVVDVIRNYAPAEPAPEQPGEPAPGPDAPAARTYVVQRGDSLWKIAKTLLGDGFLWSKLFEANSGSIKDPNLIFAGQVLVLP